MHLWLIQLSLDFWKYFFTEIFLRDNCQLLRRFSIYNTTAETMEGGHKKNQKISIKLNFRLSVLRTLSVHCHKVPKEKICNKTTKFVLQMRCVIIYTFIIHTVAQLSVSSKIVNLLTKVTTIFLRLFLVLE